MKTHLFQPHWSQIFTKLKMLNDLRIKLTRRALMFPHDRLWYQAP